MPINFTIDNIGSDYLSSPVWFSVIVVIILLAVFYWNVHDSLDKKFDYINRFLKMLIIGWVAVGILSLVTFNYVESNYKKTYMSSNGQELITATTQNVGGVRPNFNSSDLNSSMYNQPPQVQLQQPMQQPIQQVVMPPIQPIQPMQQPIQPLGPQMAI